MDAGAAKTALTLAERAYRVLAKATPTGRTEAAYGEIVHEDMQIETNALARQTHEALERILEDHRWSERAPEECPTDHDVAHALASLVESGKRAGTNRKREILYRAFYRRFDPEYYLAGQSTLLWDIAAELEYPDFVTLDHLRSEHDEALDRISRTPGLAPRHASAQVQPDSEHWPHLDRLERRGLIYVTDKSSIAAHARMTTLGRALIAFAWLPLDHPDRPAEEAADT